MADGDLLHHHTTQKQNPENRTNKQHTHTLTHKEKQNKRAISEATMRPALSYFTSRYSRVPSYELPVDIITEEESDIDDDGQQEMTVFEEQYFDDKNKNQCLSVFEIEDVEPYHIEIFEIDDVECQDEQEEESYEKNIHHPTKISPPINCVCPLTLKIMENPVNDNCGHSFERAAICDWLVYHDMCPISRNKLQISQLNPAPILNARIQKWKENHKDYHQDDMLPVSKSSGLSKFECMLLPQELGVLEIIKHRASERRKRKERIKFLWIVAIFVLVLALTTRISMRYLSVQLEGPT